MGTATAQNQQVENRPIKSRVWNAVTIATAKTVKMMDDMHDCLQTFSIQATDYSGMSVSSSDYVTSNESYAK